MDIEDRAARVRSIILKLTAPIPYAPLPPKVIQQSWATLKVGDVLHNPEGREVRVMEVSNYGAKLSDATLLNDRLWREKGWTKVPKRRRSTGTESGSSSAPTG